MPYVTTDLFLRTRAKVHPTDLWLHPAGPSGSLPPFVFGSGTLVSIAALSSAEALEEAQTLASVAAFAGAAATTDLGVLAAQALLSAAESIAESGAVLSVVTASDAHAIAEAGLITSIAGLAASEALADSGAFTSLVVLSAAEALGERGDLLTIALLEGLVGATALPPAVVLLDGHLLVHIGAGRYIPHRRPRVHLGNGIYL